MAAADALAGTTIATKRRIYALAADAAQAQYVSDLASPAETYSRAIAQAEHDYDVAVAQARHDAVVAPGATAGLSSSVNRNKDEPRRNAVARRSHVMGNPPHDRHCWVRKRGHH